MEVEVYHKKTDAKRTTVTVTPDRITVKVARQAEFPIEKFERFADILSRSMTVDKSFRGNLGHGADGRTCIQFLNSARTLVITTFYNFETENILVKDMRETVKGRK